MKESKVNRAFEFHRKQVENLEKDIDFRKFEKDFPHMRQKVMTKALSHRKDKQEKFVDWLIRDLNSPLRCHENKKILHRIIDIQSTDMVNYKIIIE
jgi:hypothetical protein